MTGVSGGRQESPRWVLSGLQRIVTVITTTALLGGVAIEDGQPVRAQDSVPWRLIVEIPDAGLSISDMPMVDLEFGTDGSAVVYGLHTGSDPQLKVERMSPCRGGPFPLAQEAFRDALVWPSAMAADGSDDHSRSQPIIVSDGARAGDGDEASGGQQVLYLYQRPTDDVFAALDLPFDLSPEAEAEFRARVAVEDPPFVIELVVACEALVGPGSAIPDRFEFSGDETAASASVPLLAISSAGQVGRPYLFSWFDPTDPTLHAYELPTCSPADPYSAADNLDVTPGGGDRSGLVESWSVQIPGGSAQSRQDAASSDDAEAREMFAGSMEFLMLNQLSIEDADDFELDLADDASLLVGTDLADEDSVRLDYLEIIDEGLPTSTRDDDDIGSGDDSGIVSFDLDNYKVADTVLLVLEDQELDTDLLLRGFCDRGATVIEGPPPSFDGLEACLSVEAAAALDELRSLITSDEPADGPYSLSISLEGCHLLDGPEGSLAALPPQGLPDLRTFQLPGAGPSAAVLFPGDRAATLMERQAFDLDPTPDGVLPVYTFIGSQEGISYAVQAFDDCETGGGLRVFGATDHKDPISVEFTSQRGSPVQSFEIPGVAIGAGGTPPTPFIADLECTPSGRGGKRSTLNAQGTWKGGQNYSEAVKVSEAKRGNGYDTVTNTRGQVARDLGADRAGLVWTGFGQVEVTIPVSVTTLPKKNRVVVESVVVYAPAKGSPSTKQTRSTVSQLGDDELLRVRDAVAAGKTPKGGDRLGFQKNANWSILAFVFKDNARTHALLDDWFGHTVAEVPPAGTSQGPVRMRVETGDGDQTDVALASQLRLALEPDPLLDVDDADAGPTTFGTTVSLYHSLMTRGGIDLVVISDLAFPGTNHTTASYSPFDEVITRRLPSLDAALAAVDDAKTRLDVASAEFVGGYAEIAAARRLPADAPGRDATLEALEARQATFEAALEQFEDAHALFFEIEKDISEESGVAMASYEEPYDIVVRRLNAEGNARIELDAANAALEAANAELDAAHRLRGDLSFDRDETQAAVEATEARVDAAQAQVDAAQAEIDAVNAEFDVAEAGFGYDAAAMTAAQYHELHDQLQVERSGPPQPLPAKARLDSARVDLDKATVDYSRTSADLDGARFALDVMQEEPSLDSSGLPFDMPPTPEEIAAAEAQLESARDANISAENLYFDAQRRVDRAEAELAASLQPSNDSADESMLQLFDGADVIESETVDPGDEAAAGAGVATPRVAFDLDDIDSDTLFLLLR